MKRLGDGATSGFDHSLGACRGADALEGDLLGQFTRFDDLDDFCKFANKARLLEREQIDFISGQTLQVRQSDFGVVLERLGLESTLGQATLQRHLTAFEAHLVVAARTRLLTFVTATGGLAQARTDATTDAALG